MTAIGAMPDELSKVIHDFIRPTEAYEVILEQLHSGGEVIIKKFRSKESAWFWLFVWERPDDGMDYEASIHQTYPVVRELVREEYLHCYLCGEYMEENQKCCDCNGAVCTDCCRWDDEQFEFHCRHCAPEVFED